MVKLYPEQRTVGSVFPVDRAIRYTVPIYQRNYSWTNDNVEELFNDLFEEDKGYYLGNLLITENEEKRDNSYDIVDGQQRLTTLSLFYLAIYAYIMRRKRTIFSDYVGDINEITTDIPRKMFYDKLNKIPTLELQEPDKSLYLGLLELLDDFKELKPPKNRKIIKRFIYIYDLIHSKFDLGDECWVEETELASVNRPNERYFNERLNNLYNFYQKLNNADLLNIEVTNITDALQIFSSFNSTGLPLTLIDLLKSYYLSSAKSHIENEKALVKWEKLISIFYNKNQEPLSSVVNQFLQNNFDAFNSEQSTSITKSQMLDAYQKLFKNEGERYIDELIEHAGLFSTLNGKINIVENNRNSEKYTENIDYLLSEIRKLNATTVYPIILFLLKEYKYNSLSEKELVNVLLYLKNFFVRRNIILKPKSSNIRSRSLSIVKELNKDKNRENLDGISLVIVKSELNNIAAKPVEFRNALRGPIYDLSPETARIILIDIEREEGNYFDQKQNEDDLNKIQDNGQLKWTLEHIMPQSENLSDYWLEMIDPTRELPNETTIARHNDNIHKIGNLTLTGYNVELSNNDFLYKRDYPNEESEKFTGLRTELYLNQSISDKNESIKNKTSWNIEDINRRTKDLADIAETLYSLD